MSDNLIQCQVCHRWFKTITATHVATHGLTLEGYQELYGPTSVQAQQQALVASSPSLTDLATAISGDEKLLAKLGGELRGYLFSDARRGQIDAGLALLTSRYLSEAEKVQGVKAAIAEELFADWRLTMGGKDAGPTETQDLIALFKLIMDVEDRASDMVMNAAKLTVSERKNDKPLVVVNSQTNSYSGEAEQQVLAFDSGGRERLRNIIARARSGDKEAIAEMLYASGSINAERYESLTGKKAPDSQDVASAEEGTDAEDA